MINSSIAALIALRGLDEDPDADGAARSRQDPRVLCVAGGTQVDARQPAVAAQRPALRADPAGRRRHPPARAIRAARLVDLSVHATNGQEYHYRQAWGAPAGKTVPNVNWDGSEIVAVRMHLPSRIDYHNTTSRKVDRGNIVGWEQPLKDRLPASPWRWTCACRRSPSSIAR